MLTLVLGRIWQRKGHCSQLPTGTELIVSVLDRLDIGMDSFHPRSCKLKRELLVSSSNSANPALKQFRSSPLAKDVNFTVKFLPYQLYPEASDDGEDKYEWYVTVPCK